MLQELEFLHLSQIVKELEWPGLPEVTTPIKSPSMRSVKDEYRRAEGRKEFIPCTSLYESIWSGWNFRNCLVAGKDYNCVPEVWSMSI